MMKDLVTLIENYDTQKAIGTWYRVPLSFR